MSIEHTYHSVKDAVHILATSSGDIKSRLSLAMTNRFLLANIPPDPELPVAFSEKIDLIIAKLTARERNGADRVRATLRGMHNETASKIAEDIWCLYIDIENFVMSKYVS